jgi:hypothetical protein
MATIYRNGKKRIITNNGKVQLDIGSNRILVYDGTNYKFVAGDKPDNVTKIDIAKNGENVLVT